MARVRTVAAAVGLLAGVLGAPATAMADSCDRGYATGAERVVTTPKPGGYNVTEVYGEGVYRVTRCEADGDLIEGQTVAPIAEPDGDVALVPSTYSTPKGDGSVLYGDPNDPVWARAWAASGEAVKDDVIPPPKGVDIDVPEEPPALQRGSGAAGGAARRAGRPEHRCLLQRRVRPLWRDRALAGGPVHLPHQRAVVRQQREDAPVARRRAPDLGRHPQRLRLR